MGQSADQSSGQGYVAMLDMMSEGRGHLIIFNWEN